MSITPTQIQHPWITTARTVVQVVAASILSIFGIIVTLATVAPDVLAAIVAVLPPEWAAWLAGVVALLGAISAAITRLMAIPQVNAWLGKLAAPDTAPAGVYVIPMPTAEQEAALAEKAKALAK